MSSTLERPTFFYGQYLGHDDLEQALQYGRGQLARHQRTMHIPGIAYGLKITPTPASEGIKTFVTLSLGPGMAVDAFGRQIVVPEDRPIDPSIFREANVFVKDAWHPLLISLREDDPPLSPFATGACDSTKPKRKIEGYELSFGRPGDERRGRETQTEVGEGAEPAALTRLPPIVLGFVKWDETLSGGGNFTAFDIDIKTARADFAGVRADEVVSVSGRLSLRGKSVADQGTAVLQLDETTGAKLLFGLQGETDVKPLFTVDDKGNVVAAGTIESQFGLHVESGAISDGMMLPLPEGIKDEDLENGTVTLHATLTPRTPCVGNRPTAAGEWIALPIECRLDGRLVVCRGVWFKLDGGGTPAFHYEPGACDYMVVVYAPKK
jgi:hypothetical protein